MNRGEWIRDKIIAKKEFEVFEFQDSLGEDGNGFEVIFGTSTPGKDYISTNEFEQINEFYDLAIEHYDIVHINQTYTPSVGKILTTIYAL